MAKKSKTQRAKASAARAARKEQSAVEVQEAVKVDEAAKDKRAGNAIKNSTASSSGNKQTRGLEKKAEKSKKKNRLVSFLKDVRSELQRVTWPTKQDVLRWTGVVIAALLFFGLFTFVLDNGVIEPVLYAISGLGA